jgi:hypothetical protein
MRPEKTAEAVIDYYFRKTKYNEEVYSGIQESG